MTKSKSPAKPAKASNALRKAVKKVAYPLPDLSGSRGNAFYLLGTAHRLLVQNGLSEAWPFLEAEMKGGDYNHLLDTIGEWFYVYAERTTFDAVDTSTQSLSEWLNDDDFEEE